jgi:hypothetical protein
MQIALAPAKKCENVLVSDTSVSPDVKLSVKPERWVKLDPQTAGI